MKQEELRRCGALEVDGIGLLRKEDEINRTKQNPLRGSKNEDNFPSNQIKISLLRRILREI